MSPDSAGGVIDDLKSKDDNIVVIIATDFEGKQNLVAGCVKNAVKLGVMAGKLVGAVAKLTDGKGGGRPDSAMAGVGDPSKIDAALAEAENIVAGMIR